MSPPRSWWRLYRAVLTREESSLEEAKARLAKLEDVVDLVMVRRSSRDGFIMVGFTALQDFGIYEKSALEKTRTSERNERSIF